jgi:medium-chain acyl-[acyl-carrier-protein] hydrolase
MTRGSLVALTDSGSALVRLVMLPHAGGTAQAYANWQVHFPDEIDLVGVTLPLDGTNNGPRTLDGLAEALADDIAQDPHLPIVLYGHSMGGMLCYPLAQALAQRGLAPLHVAVSASRPPHVPLRRRPMHTLSDADFMSELRKLGGTPEQVLREEQLMAARLPVLRAHFHALETYAPFAGARGVAPLTCSLMAYGGLDDHLEEHEIAAWSACTKAAFAHAMLPGGHFFNRDHTARIAKDLRVAAFKSLSIKGQATASQIAQVTHA